MRRHPPITFNTCFVFQTWYPPMHILPLSWRRSIRSLLATGCVLAGVSPAVSADLPVGTDAQLRNAIVSATSGDTITFTNNIILTTGDLPLVQRNVTIRGQNFTLSGNNQFRGLFVAAFTPGTDTMIPVTVGIQDLTIQNTKAQGGLGGNGGFAGGGGGAGLGGAIFVGNLANVTL
ncbi:MAG: hypothetical protein K8T89_07455, partial [Planctomycetes bacterium]|nr:hypothetical protein [Planctomycetota bacterium]